MALMLQEDIMTKEELEKELETTEDVWIWGEYNFKTFKRWEKDHLDYLADQLSYLEVEPNRKEWDKVLNIEISAAKTIQIIKQDLLDLRGFKYVFQGNEKNNKEFVHIGYNKLEDFISDLSKVEKIDDLKKSLDYPKLYEAMQ